MGLKEQKSITNIINMAGLIFFMFDNGLERNTVQGLSFLVSSVIPFCTFFSPNLLILEEQVWGFAISD